MKTADLFDVSHTLAAPWLARTEYPWEILDRIKDIIAAIGETLPADAFDHPADGVWIAKDAEVFPSAYIGAPCIIGHGTQVRQGAFIRGGALVGDGAVIGNSTELKNCILFDGVQAPHFNYVGDAVLGYRAHLGAGAVTSNVKSDKTPVVVQNGKERIETGRRKLGAMVGDWVEVGCNSVLNPGTVIGRESRVYPLSCVRGVVPPRHIVKGDRGVFPMKP